MDIGAGDGRYVYRLARRDPESFFVGVDPNAQALAGCSARAARKPARGGLANVAYVQAAVEGLPHELDGLAHEVHVSFPWGHLLRGLVVAEPAFLRGIPRICRRDALLQIVLTYSAAYESAMVVELGLPELSLDYIDSVLAPAYARHGLHIFERRLATPEDLREVATSWGKRLLARRRRDVYVIRARAMKGRQG